MARTGRAPEAAQARFTLTEPTPTPAVEERETESSSCAIPQKLVEIDLSSQCTRQCAFCHPGIPPERRKVAKFLSWEQLNKLLASLKEVGFDRKDRWICFCGHGEPTLHPELASFMHTVRRAMPSVQIAVVTNSDRLTPDHLRAIEVCDATLVVNLYAPDVGEQIAQMVSQAGIRPQAVRVVDHCAGEVEYYTRASAVKPAVPVGSPCSLPRNKLFYTFNTQGRGGWLLCCEDYKRETFHAGNLATAIERAAVQEGRLISSRKGLTPCSKCDRPGDFFEGFSCYTRLDESRFWPPPFLAYKKDPRLIVLPVSAKWADHAVEVITAINKLSVRPGKTLVLWNDELPLPSKLHLPDTICWEDPAYPDGTGWTAINRGIGRALQYAFDNDYPWVIKLDTDTAIMRKGWDAHILLDAPIEPEQRGFFLEERVQEWAHAPLQPSTGIFTEHMQNLFEKGKMLWAKGQVNSGWHQVHHIQGGCYAINRAAVAQLQKSGVGVIPSEDEYLIGEDVLQSLRCRVAGIQQTHTAAIVSHYFYKGGFPISVAKYYRDARRASVLHPVKDIDVLKQLAKEAERGSD